MSDERPPVTPEPISDERLDEIEKRAEDATHGPWRAKDTVIWPDDPDAPVSVAFVADWDDKERIHADADFIAHARTDVPDLVAEVIRLRASLTAVEAACDEAVMRRHHSTGATSTCVDLSFVGRVRSAAAGSGVTP